MKTSTQWQLEKSAAERYQEILVPSILGPAASELVSWANLIRGQAILDAGCGTGAAAILAAEKVKASGMVYGVDVNASMLAVAKSLPKLDGAKIRWLENSLYELPLKNEIIDVVLCAQTLQFLKEPLIALGEIHRVLNRHGKVVLSTWNVIEKNPYFLELILAVSQHISAEVAGGLQAIFRLSDIEKISKLLLHADFHNIQFETKELILPLPDLFDFVPRHIQATPMASGFRGASMVKQMKVINQTCERLRCYKNGYEFHIPFNICLVSASK